MTANFSDYHSKRVVEFGSINRRPQGHHRGHGWIAHLDFGASFPKERAVQCYPYGQLDYVWQHEKRYTETHAQSLDNVVSARSTAMLRSEAGLQGRFCSPIKNSTIIPSAKLGWVRETRFKGKKIHARLIDVPNAYTVEGLYPDRSMLIAGASVIADLYDGTVHLVLTYEGLFGSRYQSNSGNASLNFRF